MSRFLLKSCHSKSLRAISTTMETAIDGLSNEVHHLLAMDGDRCFPTVWACIYKTFHLVRSVLQRRECDFMWSDTQ